jgi:hypothetical protein
VPGEEENYDKEIEVCGHLWPGILVASVVWSIRVFPPSSYEYLWLVCHEAVVITVAGAILIERWNTGEQLSLR